MEYEKYGPYLSYQDRLTIAQQRRALALELHRSGLKLKEIGAILGGICVERARQIILKAKKNEMRSRIVTTKDKSII